MAGRTAGVEEKLLAAETSLHNAALDSHTRNLIGQIACARATLAVTRYDPQTMVTQARRALEYLPPDNLIFQFTANWALAFACLLQGDRAGAAQPCQRALAFSQENGSIFSKSLASFMLGDLQRMDNQLHQAAATYRHVLELSGDHPHPNIGGVHLALAHICYEWNDLEAADRHGRLGLQLNRQFDPMVDRSIVSEVFLARVSLARGDSDGAAAQLAEAEHSAREQSFTRRLPEIAELQGLVLLRQGQAQAAAELVRQYDLALSQARVLIALNDPSAALAVLDPRRQQMEARGWADELLKTLVLQALALHAHGEQGKAVQCLGDALALAEPGGFIRLFVDEGPPMAQLLRDAASHGVLPGYVGQLLAALDTETPWPAEYGHDSSCPYSPLSRPQPLIEPLSQRELGILTLIAQGLSNREIGARLFLALDTVKGHNRRIFDKLQVQSRTEAIARARQLGLLQQL